MNKRRNLEHAQPNRIELLPAEVTVHRLGGAVEEQAEEVSHKARTRQAIGFQGVLEILDQILTLPALAIRLVRAGQCQTPQGW